MSRKENSELLGAIRREDLDKIRKLAQEGEDISSPLQEANYMTPLHIAIYNHNIDMARLLIELGADINVENPVSGHNYISMFCRQYEEYEYWDKLEDFLWLYAEHQAWKEVKWCRTVIDLIFDKGWPRAVDFFSRDF